MTTTSKPRPATPEVSESLETLVDALDKLKSTLGYDDQSEFRAIEEFMHQLQEEKEELRQCAQEAIKEAQRFRGINDDLAARLQEAEQAALENQLGEVLMETQKLQAIGADFDRGLLESKLIEAETAIAESQALKQRIEELEEENAGLSATLQEMRTSSQQLQALAALEQKAAISAAAQAAALGCASPTQSPRYLPDEEEMTPRKTVAESSVASELYGTPASSIGGPPPGSGDHNYAGSVSTSFINNDNYGTPSGGGKDDPSKVADQLVAATGGAETGLVAQAAKLLRRHAAMEADLAAQKAESERLQTEIERLTETMSSKTFKAPSAWAEREVKYRQDMKRWDEERTALEAEILDLRAGVAGGVSSPCKAKGTLPADMDHLAELEAALLQERREKTDALARLHEVQLSQRVTGEFGRDGFESPYKGPRGAGQAKDLLKDRTGIEELSNKIESLELENRNLKDQLTDTRPVRLKVAVAGGGSPTAGDASKQAAELQKDLQRTNAEKSALQAELKQIKANMLTPSELNILQKKLIDAEKMRHTVAGELHGLNMLPVIDAGRIAELEAQLEASEMEVQELRWQVTENAQPSTTKVNLPSVETGADRFVPSQAVVTAALLGGIGMSAQVAALQDQLKLAQKRRAALNNELLEAAKEKPPVGVELGTDGSSTDVVDLLERELIESHQRERSLLSELSTLRKVGNPISVNASESVSAAITDQLAATKSVYEVMTEQFTSLEENLEQQRAEKISIQAAIQSLEQSPVDQGEALHAAALELKRAQRREAALLAQLADLRPITVNIKADARGAVQMAPVAAIAANENTTQSAAIAASSALRNQIEALHSQLQRQKAAKEGLQLALSEGGNSAPENKMAGATAALEIALAKERLKEEMLQCRLDNLKPLEQQQKDEGKEEGSKVLLRSLKERVATLQKEVRLQQEEKAQLAAQIEMSSSETAAMALKVQLEEVGQKEKVAMAQLEDLQPIRLQLALVDANTLRGCPPSGQQNSPEQQQEQQQQEEEEEEEEEDSVDDEITHALSAARAVYSRTKQTLSGLQNNLDRHRVLQRELAIQVAAKQEVQEEIVGLDPSSRDLLMELEWRLDSIETREKGILSEMTTLQEVSIVPGKEVRLVEGVSEHIAAAEVLKAGMHKQVDALNKALAKAQADRERAAGSGLFVEVEEAEEREEILRARLDNLQPVVLKLNMLGESSAAMLPAEEAIHHLTISLGGQSQREELTSLQELESKLAEAQAREAALEAKLKEGQPVNVRLNLGGGALSRQSSGNSFKYSQEQATQLAKERAAADAEWEDYTRNSDLPALIRTKAELETRCSVLEQQISRMQGALAEADEDQAALREGVEAALESGDVKALSSIADKLRAGRTYLGGRISPVGKKLFKRPNSAGKPSSKEVHATAANISPGGNAFKRSLSKFSSSTKKALAPSTTSTAVATMQEEVLPLGSPVSTSVASTGAATYNHPSLRDTDASKNESELLMEHLVATKVLLAESEGDRLESRRALLRSREKQLEMAKQINELRAKLSGTADDVMPMGGEELMPAAYTSAFTTTPPRPIGEGTPSSDKKKGGLRIPGIEFSLR